MFESSKEENLLMNKKIANQIEEIDRLQQENKSLKVNPHNLLPAFWKEVKRGCKRQFKSAI